MEYINKPKISHSVIILYASPLILSILIFILVPLLASKIVTAFVAIVMIVHLIFIVTTKYKIHDNLLSFRSIYGTKTIDIKEIEDIQKVEYRTLRPFIKTFGSSLYAGYYWSKQYGKMFITITNRQDLLLIKTKDTQYLISPSNPEEFYKKIKIR